MYQGLANIPGVDPTAIDYSAPWASAWYCNGSFLSSLIPACAPPTVSQLTADSSGYGKSLSPESQAAATSMAISAVNADMAANPCNYASIDPTAAAACSPFSGLTLALLAIGGVVLFSLVRR